MQKPAVQPSSSAVVPPKQPTRSPSPEPAAPEESRSPKSDRLADGTRVRSNEGWRNWQDTYPTKTKKRGYFPHKLSKEENGKETMEDIAARGQRNGLQFECYCKAHQDGETWSPPGW